MYRYINEEPSETEAHTKQSRTKPPGMIPTKMFYDGKMMYDIILHNKVSFFNIKNRKTAHLPLVVYILWPQWFGIRKQCHSTWSHLGINSGMGGNETLDQFMSGPHLLLSRSPRKGKWGTRKDSEEKHTGFNQFLKITLNTVSENLSYCLKETKKRISTTKPTTDLCPH